MKLSDADRDLVDRWLVDLRARRKQRGRVGEVFDQQEKSVPDAEDEVLAILLDDSDPVRGWDLVMRMLSVAIDDYEIRAIGVNALETLLREHGDALAEVFGTSIRADQRLREAVQHIYLSGKVAGIARTAGLYDHPGLSGHNGGG
jgi:hypothetical protein